MGARKKFKLPKNIKSAFSLRAVPATTRDDPVLVQAVLVQAVLVHSILAHAVRFRMALEV